MTKFLSGNEIRKTFLRFFEERGHKIVRSSSLVPANDPTLLFTNAGMNQFKDLFLGLEKREYNRATTCQKCVRAGGKHNDLENVGFTNRHHTFFEMLGNFSFMNYFKEEAIAYAMELVTSPEWFGLPLEKLYFTIFNGERYRGFDVPKDEQAQNSWLSQGVSPERIFELGVKENFWAMGESGPCGPCSEIHYDMGPKASEEDHIGPNECQFPCDCGRYMEIWNLVFIQYNLEPAKDGAPGAALRLLPSPSIDTGMGLERVATILQGEISNYDTDLFLPLIHEAATLTGVNIEQEKLTPYQVRGSGRFRLGGRLPSLRIIADHSRAATFLIGDGVLPSNEGRGYVLRKIIRRALQHVRFLGGDFPFLPKISNVVVREMKSAYPELVENAERTARVLEEEERRFARIIEVGRSHLISMIDEHKGLSPSFPEYYSRKFPNQDSYELYKRLAPLTAEDFSDVSAEDLRSQIESRTPNVADPAFARQFFDDRRKGVILKGGDVFKLYDTYGLPRDFIDDVRRDAGIEVDWAGFDQAMQEQRTRARASWKGAHKEAANPVYSKLAQAFKTEPDFYFGTQVRDARIEGIVTKQGAVNEIKAGTEAEIVLDRTSIYSESGGQVADTGAFYDNDMSLQVAEVKGAYYPVSGLVAHRIVAKEDLHVGDRVATVADPLRRARDMRNHTATHLMHAALRNILGTHVKQAGSLVAPDHLRFDFSHFASVDASELAEIEQQVNEEILRDLALSTDIMNIDDALTSGALAFFGDKYPESNVRVVTIPDPSSPRGFYSKELCGGTHVGRTGEIGVFKITGEQSVAAGVRRIEAISGDCALAEYQRALGTLRSVSQMLNAGEGDVVAALERQIEATRQLEKQLEALKSKAAGSTADSLLGEARKVKDVRVLAAKVSGFDRDALRQMVDTLRQKLGSGVVVLVSADDGKVALITGVTKDLVPRLHAGKIVQELAKLVGGSGGGRPDLAEAGGKDTSAIDSTLSTVYPLVERLLQS